MFFGKWFAKANFIIAGLFANANPLCGARRGRRKKDMPPLLAPIGQEVRIVKIIADERTKKHLANLGVLVDATVTVLSASGGSTVCRVKEGRLALDRNVASHIFVA